MIIGTMMLFVALISVILIFSHIILCDVNGIINKFGDSGKRNIAVLLTISVWLAIFALLITELVIALCVR